MVLLARSGHPSVNVGSITEDLRTAEFVTLHRRTKVGHAPQALEDVSRLIVHEVVRVSELLEIPTVVASTDLLGIFLSSMEPFMEKAPPAGFATPTRTTSGADLHDLARDPPPRHRAPMAA